jgi:hypothetical protein
MSEIMLLGVLRMPLPDDPRDLDWLTWLQIKDRMQEAAAEIERLRAALAEIAAYRDFNASMHLERTGRFSQFDEPESVQIARAALEVK